MFKKIYLKRIVLITVAISFIIFMIHVVNIIMYSKNVEYINFNFKSEKVTPELNGYKIVFITDTHQMPGSSLLEVVKTLNSQGNNDLIVLGGDFPNHDATYRSMDILSKLDNKDGIYGIEGNHDIREELLDAMKTYGIVPLLNQGLNINDDLFLAGVEDLWYGNPIVSDAVKDAEKDDFVLLLCHNPDVTMQQNMSAVDLTLSGHTHGGQVTFLGLWAPALTNSNTITDYGQRFMSGLCYNKEGYPVYVSNGTGYIDLVPRVFARPQVITIILQSDTKI